jgi:hypothetical protein
MQDTATIQPRMPHVAALVPEALQAMREAGEPEERICSINVWSRLNVTTKTPAGSWI